MPGRGVVRTNAAPATSSWRGVIAIISQKWKSKLHAGLEDICKNNLRLEINEERFDAYVRILSYWCELCQKWELDTHIIECDCDIEFWFETPGITFENIAGLREAVLAADGFQVMPVEGEDEIRIQVLIRNVLREVK